MNSVSNSMKNARDLQVFNNNEFGNIRVAEIEGETWFCLKDVCDCLEIKNSSDISNRLDKEVAKIYPLETKGGKQNFVFVDESGLYEVIIRSNSPKAKPFRKWVCGEVLPSIRKHGMYATDVTIDRIISDPSFGIALLTNLKEERMRRQAAEVTIETNRPKVEYADRCLAATNGMTVGQFSKLLLKNGYETGERRLFQWLRDNRYIYRKGKNNLPYQKWIRKGYFDVKKSVYTCKDEEKTTLTPMITEKGQMFLMDLMLSA